MNVFFSGISAAKFLSLSIWTLYSATDIVVPACSGDAAMLYCRTPPGPITTWPGCGAVGGSPVGGSAVGISPIGVAVGGRAVGGSAAGGSPIDVAVGGLAVGGSAVGGSCTTREGSRGAKQLEPTLLTKAPFPIELNGDFTCPEVYMPDPRVFASEVMLAQLCPGLCTVGALDAAAVPTLHSELRLAQVGPCFCTREVLGARPPGRCALRTTGCALYPARDMAAGPSTLGRSYGA